MKASKIQKTLTRRILRVALLQLACGFPDKQQNWDAVETAVKTASDKGCDLIVLPEIWNGPYDTSKFKSFAEAIPSGPSTALLKRLGRETGKIIVGGSIAELTMEGKVFNTCITVDGQGDLIGKHRKVHLFDIDVPGGITFKESDSLSAGAQPCVIPIDDSLTLGVGICYDVRFPRYAETLVKCGANVLVYPAAFNMTTGPPHWQLLFRGRALDAQAYVLACSPARSTQSSYTAYGHSLAVNPWGEVIASTGHEPDIVYAELDLGRVEEVRQSIPTSLQQRPDVYSQ